MKSRNASLLLLLLLIPSAGCESDTGPQEESSRVFELISIDGAPLPAAVASVPGDSIIILWATLILDKTHHATLTTHQSHRVPPNPEVVSTFVVRNEWGVHADSITVGYLGRCRDLCPVNSVGRLGDSSLTLTAAILPRSLPVYAYRLVGQY